MTTWVKLPFGSHAAALGDEDWGERLGNELCTPGRPMGRRVKNKGRSRITDRGIVSVGTKQGRLTWVPLEHGNHHV